jgi:hypothetical protein
MENYETILFICFCVTCAAVFCSLGETPDEGLVVVAERFFVSTNCKYGQAAGRSLCVGCV